MKDNEKVEKRINTIFDNYFTQFEAIHSINKMFPEAIYIPPTRGWAGSPDFLLKLIEIVITDAPKYVLELGSGVSSIVIGLALNKFSKGKLVSIDHDNSFANKTQKFIEVNNLKGTVDVKFCPITEYNFDNKKWKWYDLSQINFENKIDLLVVDGPPRKLQEKSRYPALPILIDKLSPGATIIIDDANRNDEQEVVKEWELFLTQSDIKFVLHKYPYYEKGLAIIKLESKK